MRHAQIIIVALGGIVLGAAQTLASPPQLTPTCDTTYVGPPGGAWQHAENWSTGIPKVDDVACVPGAVANSLDLPDTLTVRIVRADSHETVNVTSDPPPVGAFGACCLGSSCVETDWFDCRELGGYLRLGVPVCDAAICSSGVCCEDDPSCTADDGVGGPMDEGLCDLIGGTYVGGAACDGTDPCQRLRLPLGYEIDDADFSEGLAMIRPTINNCGEVAYPVGLHWESFSEIFLFDNGAVTQITDNTTADGFPDVNDNGTMVYRRDVETNDEIVLRANGAETILMEGNLGVPRVNNRGHATWAVREPEGCEPSGFKADIWVYDGTSAWELFDNLLSNQIAVINDHDELAWTSYTFPCGGGAGDWTADILLYDIPPPQALPSTLTQCQSVALNNAPLAAWDCDLGSELWDGTETTIFAEGNNVASNFSLNDRGDIAYNGKTTFTPWQLYFEREGNTYHVSHSMDIADHIDNHSADLNEFGEMSWRSVPNGQLSPSVVRFMRRIRNGDTDFDGDVDPDDFVGMPGCYTGPTATDGLCECRFYDIDHDRDVDTDDLDYLLRNYSGPLDDCNANTTPDLEELLVGSAGDCNLNGRIDSCDLSDDPGLDSDADGILDVCCSPGAPAPELIAGEVSVKNRFLSFEIAPLSGVAGVLPQHDDGVFAPWSPLRYWTSSLGNVQAVRVTFVDLPEPFDVLNGQSMWVAEPQEVSENGSTVEPIPGFANFWAATLSCSPHYADWSALGTVHVYHEGIVPKGTYDIQVINQGCGEANESNFSSALTITNALWGDTIKDCQNTPCAPPDGIINIVDITAIIGRFVSAQDSIHKSRADLEPSPPDLKVNITDVLAGLTGFQGVDYPFALANPNPCGK